MPRVNPFRSLANARNVARRIQFERTRRGMSYEGLAKRLTDAGSPIQATAIFKIEKGDPPRRITVDELVGFATVFDLSLDEMLLPMELVKNRRAAELAEEWTRAGAALTAVAEQLHRMYAEYFRMAHDEPDEVRQHFHELAFGRVPKSLEEDPNTTLPDGVAEAGQALVLAIMHAAADQVDLEMAGGSNGQSGAIPDNDSDD
jgi:transcriptional regulator with XRE-family HTH domain